MVLLLWFHYSMEFVGFLFDSYFSSSSNNNSLSFNFCFRHASGISLVMAVEQALFFQRNERFRFAGSLAQYFSSLKQMHPLGCSQPCPDAQMKTHIIFHFLLQLCLFSQSYDNETGVPSFDIFLRGQYQEKEMQKTSGKLWYPVFISTKLKTLSLNITERRLYADIRYHLLTYIKGHGKLEK